MPALYVVVYSQSTEQVFTHAHAAQKPQVCEQVKITWSQVRTIGRMREKKSQAFCAQKTRLTARTSQSAKFFSSSFIFKNQKKSQGDRIRASFNWLLTKRLLRSVAFEMLQLFDLRKCYSQTVYSFWTTIFTVGTSSSSGSAGISSSSISSSRMLQNITTGLGTCNRSLSLLSNGKLKWILQK
jgi:hypothetical protein